MKAGGASAHILVASACAMAAAACPAAAANAAETYPVRPVRLIIPSGPGGGTDK